MKKIKFAILGCGRIFNKHANAIVEHLKDEAELVAVCDNVEKKAKIAGEKYKIPYFFDKDKMIEKLGDKFDVISILTPSGFHSEHSIWAATNGKNVVVEKPMALSLQDADNMIKSCDNAGVKLFVVKQNRYNLPIVKLKEALDSGRFGKLVLGTIRVRWCRTDEYYNLDNWRGTWKMDGGVLTNQASHHIDILEWFFGEPLNVFAVSRTALSNIEVEDTAVAVIQFVNGALGIVEATTATRPKDLEGSVSVLGENGSVIISGFAMNKIETWDFNKMIDSDNNIKERINREVPNVYGFGHIQYLKEVCNSIKKGKKALVDGLEGRKSLELITAFYESIETGISVSMRFKPKKCKLGI